MVDMKIMAIVLFCAGFSAAAQAELNVVCPRRNQTQVTLRQIESEFELTDSSSWSLKDGVRVRVQPAVNAGNRLEFLLDMGKSPQRLYFFRGVWDCETGASDKVMLSITFQDDNWQLEEVVSCSCASH